MQISSASLDDLNCVLEKKIYIYILNDPAKNMREKGPVLFETVNGN